MWQVGETQSSGGVGMWRGGLGAAYPLPVLSGAGVSLADPYSVSTSRSSNRTCGFPASGFRTRTHACAHGKLRVSTDSFINPNVVSRYASGQRDQPELSILCFPHNHRRSR